MSVVYESGLGWCDVVWTSNGFVRVWSDAGAVACVHVNGHVLWREAVPTDHLRYLRAACSPSGDVAAIGVGADDIAYLVTHQSCERWGQVYGQNAVGLYWQHGWVPVIQRTSESYSVGQEWRAFPAHLRGTSQGFRDVRPNGEIVFGDEAHVLDWNGISLHKPCQRGGIVVGQIDGSDRIDGIVGFAQHVPALIPGPAYEPHAAASDTGEYAICARTPRGAAFLVVPPYPSPDPVPPDPVPPDDEDEPEPPVVSMLIPASLKPSIRILSERYAHLRKGTDDERRAFALIVAQQACHELGDEWGTKQADPGRPPSKDALARRHNGRLYAWDIVNGDTRELQLDGEAEDITGQVFIPVQAVNHVGTPDDGDDDETDPPDIEAILRRLAELEDKYDALLADKDRTEQRLQDVEREAANLWAYVKQPVSVVGNTSRTWGHNHTVSIEVRR